MPRQAWMEQALDDPDYQVDTAQGQPADFSGPLGGKAVNATLTDEDIEQLTTEFVAKVRIVAALANKNDVAGQSAPPSVTEGWRPISVEPEAPEPTEPSGHGVFLLDVHTDPGLDRGPGIADRWYGVLLSSVHEELAQQPVELARWAQDLWLEAERFFHRAYSVHTYITVTLGEEVSRLMLPKWLGLRWHPTELNVLRSAIRAQRLATEEAFSLPGDLFVVGVKHAAEPLGRFPDRPQASEAALNLAWFLERRGELQQAEYWYRHADPSRVRAAALGLARLLERHGQLEQAEYWYRQAAMHPPEADLPNPSEATRRR